MTNSAQNLAQDTTLGGVRGAASSALRALGNGSYRPGDVPITFGDSLRRAGVEPTAQERAHATARELVAIALVQPTLKALRESNQAAPPFAPGDAERRFGSMLDAEHAQRIVNSANFPLVAAVRDRLLAGAGLPQGSLA